MKTITNPYHVRVGYGTVKPAMRDHPTGPQKVVLYDRWSFIGGTNV